MVRGMPYFIDGNTTKQTMSETNTPAVAPISPAPQETMEQFIERLKTYDTQAEASLAQLQTNIENYNSQIN